MVVELPAMGSISTTLACLSCPLSIFYKEFVVNLVCIPLAGLDVVLGMNWLRDNYVHINCFNKSLRFSSMEEEEAGLVTAKQLKKLVSEEAQVFTLLALMSVENQNKINELEIVRDFAEVFPDEIPEVPPEREVEFGIELVPGTRPVSMAPYRMLQSCRN